jgi:hypothetical protein
LFNEYTPDPIYLETGLFSVHNSILSSRLGRGSDPSSKFAANTAFAQFLLLNEANKEMIRERAIFPKGLPTFTMAMVSSQGPARKFSGF